MKVTLTCICQFAYVQLERKRLRLEKRRQEEEEERKMTEEEKEDAVDASYASYLASFGNLTLSTANKAADYVPASELL